MDQVVAAQAAREAADLLSPTGRAQLWVAPGRAVYVGPSLHLDAHTGAVACLGLGLAAPFTLEVPGRAPVVARSALVPARLKHRIVSGGGRMAFLYLDPDAHPHRSVSDRMTGTPTPGLTGIATGHRDEPTLLDLAETGAGPALMAAASGNEQRSPTDRRIRHALRTMQQPGGVDIPTAALAADAGLSPSRFLRLFVEQTETGLRCYRRWARMIAAAKTLAAGADVTRAAADAGFATPSHFTVAFRRMFGLTPSRLLRSGVQIIHSTGVAESASATGR